MTATRRNTVFSVVVCSLGTARLEETVESIVASAERADAAVQVIVVWQGRGSHPVCPEEVTTIEVAPIGVSNARNRGLAAATAPVVAFVDDDELVDPAWVGALLAGFDPRSAAAAFGPVEPLDDGESRTATFHPASPVSSRAGRWPPWMVGTGGNMAFDRAALVDLGGFDLRLGPGAEGRSAEESDVIVRLLRSGADIVWLPELGVYHPTKDEQEHLAVRYPYGYGMGRVVRKHRAARIGARYLVAALQSYVTGWRTHNPRRRREALATLRGFLAGALTPVN